MIVGLEWFDLALVLVLGIVRALVESDMHRDALIARVSMGDQFWIFVKL